MEPDTVNHQVLLLTRQGAEELIVLCNSMGHGFNINEENKSLVIVPFVKWERVPDMPLVHLTLVEGVEVLLNKDCIRGQCTVKEQVT